MTSKIEERITEEIKLLHDRLIEFKKVETRGKMQLSDENFFKVFNSIPIPMTIATLDEGRFISVNKPFYQALGFSEKELVGRRSIEFGIWKTPAQRKEIVKIIKNKGLVYSQEVLARTKSGNFLTMLWSGVVMTIQGIPCLLALSQDITERKKMEQALKECEQKQLEDNILLEEKNLALRALLRHVENERNKTKEDIEINVEKFIKPILNKLRIKGASPKYIKLLEDHLRGLTSSFGRKITQRSLGLSLREIEICDKIKSGLASKDIAELLNVSCQTIAKHRKNVRKKLGLSNKKINLASYLQKT
ncbi:MAG TPA: PAS domain S-box protein [Candidatus Margulisiibacteriota bacterium]|nr:PAS domain S-box protein [Candidatus Margulisiibacteriota bacterium]